MKKVIGVVVALLVLVGAFALIESSHKTTPDTASSPTPTATSSQATQTDKVDIMNFAFAPGNITVKAGTAVTWTNQDTTGHTVTSDSGSELSSALLAKGQNYSHTFAKAGTYTYHCSVHPDMHGTVTVTQ